MNNNNKNTNKKNNNIILIGLLLIATMATMFGCSDKPKKDIGIGPVKEMTLSDSINVQQSQEGQNIFNAKCKMCHGLDKKVIGPALGDVLSRRSPEWIMNMILNPDQMVKENEAARQLFEEYNKIAMMNQNLSENDARSILEYIRSTKEN